jgi:hypothetical protein
MRVLRILTACGFISVAVASPAVAADPVLEWNEIAATNVGPVRGPAGILDMAKVHLAVHDAVQAYFHNAETYCAEINNASGSVSAAVAAAARDVLVGLLPPAQDATVEAAYQAFLKTNGLIGNAGIAVGQQAAACLLKLRAGDGSFPAVEPIFAGGTKPGEWRPNPGTTSMAQPWFATVTPFAAKSTDQFGVNSPPKNLKSGAYARDYNEVKTLGGKTSTALTIVTRTGAQTELANFFSEGFLTLIQRVVRDILNRYARDLSESARALALGNVAASDALIGAWGGKIEFNFWRPIHAIREGNLDSNAQTDADPAWEPFIATGTPNYPDHPSGANNLTSSLMRTMQLFFHSDRLPFTAETRAAAAAQKFRTYESFTDFRHDVVDVRIYQGIHFRTADEVAFLTGQQSADWAFSHILRPIH